MLEKKNIYDSSDILLNSSAIPNMLHKSMLLISAAEGIPVVLGEMEVLANPTVSCTSHSHPWSGVKGFRRDLLWQQA